MPFERYVVGADRKSLKRFFRLGRALATPAGNGLAVEVATTIADLQALEADYDRLLQATGNTLPFALHEWHVAWCKQFLESGELLSAQPLFHVARNSAGECVAIAPLILTRRNAGPIKVGSLDLLGADPALTEIRTSLIAPGYEESAAWAIQQQLNAVPDIDWLNWSVVSDKHAKALCSCARIQFQRPLLDYILDLPSSWESLRANLTRNVRESIRHCYNSLKREGLSCELRVAQDPSAVKEALERFFTLHALRAALPGTVPHRNHFATARSRRFLHEVCARLAIRGVVRVFQLVIDGEVVALRVGFALGDSLYLYYSGFDPRWSKYSVMTTTLVEIIKYAIAEGFKSINLSPSKDRSKTRWSPREVTLKQAVQIARSPLSRLAWASFQRAKSDRPLPSWISKGLRLGTRAWD
ncbi:MAG TPA: GNAT family N-acetyltransferase [Steroidobacteraceae bacterium]|nr:GNAT family N-acetyltransferase [Steroidobacteraceae bacterium]